MVVCCERFHAHNTQYVWPGCLVILSEISHHQGLDSTRDKDGWTGLTRLQSTACGLH